MATNSNLTNICNSDTINGVSNTASLCLFGRRGSLFRPQPPPFAWKSSLASSLRGCLCSAAKGTGRRCVRVWGDGRKAYPKKDRASVESSSCQPPPPHPSA